MTTQLYQIHTVKTRSTHWCETCEAELPAGSQVTAQSVPARSRGPWASGAIRTRYWCTEHAPKETEPNGKE